MIDYKKLLAKYMAHVGIREGTYFLGTSLNKAPFFSNEEKNELWELREEAEEYDY